MSMQAILQVVCAALHDARIPFMLTGSVAAAFHGASRATMDIDVVIDPVEAQLEVFVGIIECTGAYVSRDAAREALQHRTMFNVVDTESGWKVDLMIRKDRAFSTTELERREAADVFGVALAIATLEDVILSKLEWAKLGASARQLEDVRTLLRLRGEDVDTAYIERWLDALGIRSQWTAVSTSVP